MKTLWLCFAVLCCLSRIQAQITITGADMPSANDTFRYSNAAIDTLILNNIEKTGANFHWDFSKLRPTGQGVEKYEPAGSTPYKSFFLLKPGEFGVKIADSMNFNIVEVTNIYNFFNKSSSSFSIDGLGFTFSGIPYAASYKTMDRIYNFPLNYNNRDSNSFYFKMSVPTLFDYYKRGYRISTVDGWGSITTPFGTFNCLRVKSIVIETDSVISSLLPFPVTIPVRQAEYRWITNSVKIPVLLVTGNINGYLFTPVTVRYRDNYLVVDVQPDPSDNFNIFPNPVSGNSLNIDYHNVLPGNLKISLFDMNGKEIRVLSEKYVLPGTIHECIILENGLLKPGIYLVKLVSGDRSVIKKIVVKK